MTKKSDVQEEKNEKVKFQDWTPGMGGDSLEEGNWELPEGTEGVWEDIEEAKQVPPGVYNIVVEKVVRGTSEISGNKKISWWLTVVDGPFAGKKLFKNHTILKSIEDPENPGEFILIPHPKTLPFVKGDFACCQIMLTGELIPAILNALPQLPGILLKVSAKKQKGDFDGLNVSFKEYMGRMEMDSDGSPLAF